MAYVVMACMVMACIVMGYIVMALYSDRMRIGSGGGRVPHVDIRARRAGRFGPSGGPRNSVGPPNSVGLQNSVGRNSVGAGRFGPSGGPPK